MATWVHPQLLRSRLRDGFVPIAVETDTLTAQPTLPRTSGLFTVDFGHLQPRSAWRTLALNVLNMLVLVFTNIASPVLRFPLSICPGLRHATYRTTSRIGIEYGPNERATVKE
jgi:hypothetical protein